MPALKDQIFGPQGYSTDLRLAAGELAIFRGLINDQWLATIAHAHPDLSEAAAAAGIENYHRIADRVEHKKLWPKANRVLPQHAVETVKGLPFFATLKHEFGDFEISDVYDTHQHHGHEEIYWRLVRPNVGSDVGSIHADTWFHRSFNMGHGMFAPGTATVKIWIPIYCEPGKNGLAIVKGSHTRDWSFHVETIEGLPKPVPDQDLSNVGAELVATEPGNMVIFHEKTLHGGVVNRGNGTRVSAEITMVLSGGTRH